MKTLIKIIILCTFSNAFGQYLDTPGLLTRSFENKMAQEVYKESLKTSTAYLGTGAATSAEELSRTRLNFNLGSFDIATINYLEYSSMCNHYWNPLRRKACTNRFNYLKEAHMQVMQLMTTPTSGRISQGMKELIGEKYTGITNIILKELEEMKRKAEENTFSHMLLD